MGREKFQTKKEFEDFFINCDALLRSGQVTRARDLLATLSLRNLPRDFCENIAALLNRAGLPRKGIEVLFPIIHPKISDNVPSSQEVTTYAKMLIRLGSLREAHELLNRVDPTFSEIYLCRGFAFQSNWDYEAAIPHLKKFITAQTEETYHVAIARVNLVASLIGAGQYEEAHKLLDRLFETARKANWTLLFKNLQELAGQLAVATDDLLQAKKFLQEAGSTRYQEDSLWDFLIEKWTSFVNLKLEPNTANLCAIKDLRKKAEQIEHWESLRECDRVLALTTQDSNLLLKVYYGTPYTSYRRKIRKEAADWIDPSTEDYVHGPKGGVAIDLTTGQCSNKDLSLKPGQIMHRCLQILSSDLYRPIFVGNLYSQLFPGEYYNPLSSTNRTTGLIKRLRTWFETNDLSINVNLNRQMFRLEWESRDLGNPLSLRYSSSNQLGTEQNEELQYSVKLEQLRLALKKSAQLSAAEAASAMETSRSGALRILNWGVQSGHLERHGSGKFVSYTLAKKD